MSRASPGYDVVREDTSRVPKISHHIRLGNELFNTAVNNMYHNIALIHYLSKEKRQHARAHQKFR